MTLPVGTLIDSRFKILGVIGEGGMATVYRAEQFGVNRAVALKIMHMSLEARPDQRARFLREAQVLARFDHPGIVQFFHFGIADGHPYLAMEFCEGSPLASVINGEEGLLPWTRAVCLMASVAEAMNYTHECGVIHRDLSPLNILVQKVDGDCFAIKVVDFGLALFKQPGAETLTVTGSLVGSVRYMSPEQCRGDRAHPESDVYAMGCILYQMLTGQPPFEADTSIAMLYKHLNEDRPTLKITSLSPEVQGLLDRVIGWSMAKSPVDRPTASQLASLLRLLERQQFSEVESILDGVQLYKKGSAKQSFAGKLLMAMTCFLFLITVVCGVTLKAPNFDEHAIGDQDLRSRNLQTTSLTHLVDDLNRSKANWDTCREVLNRWRVAHKIQAINADKITNETLVLSSKYVNVNPGLAGAVSDLGLQACVAADVVNMYHLNCLLLFKSNLLHSNNQLEGAEEALQLLDPEKLPIKSSVEKEILRASLLQLRTGVAIASKRLDSATELLCYYFSTFRGKRAAHADNYTVFGHCMAVMTISLENGNTKRFAKLATSALPWLRSLESKPAIPNQFLQQVGSIIAWSLREGRSPDIANEYWSALSASQQKVLESMAGRQLGLDQLFGKRGEFDRAVRYCLSQADYWKTRNSTSRLDLLREAVHWQSLAAHRHLTPEQLVELEDLLFSVPMSDADFVHRLEATCCHLRDYGKRDLALKLLDRAFSESVYSKFSPESQRLLRNAYITVAGRTRE